MLPSLNWSSVTVLLVRENREYLLNPGDTLETDLGILELPEDISPGDTVETHLGKEFIAQQLRGPDLFEHFERTGAPMIPRDIGLILGETGVSTGDRVLDAGTGTGVLAAYCARSGAYVTTYEIDQEFADVARENMELGGVSDRVDVRTGDIVDAVSAITDQYDVLTLDTADAPEVIKHAPDVVAEGGAIAVYTPFVEDARNVAETANDVGLRNIETVETIQREMDFDDRGSRPSTRGVGHTGYITFARH
ncbi:tRNA (adenine-N1)-methyltransferase [Salinarchaeum sp. IM2453]|nr:tRNA (adenine-N1)-methyltransferase [Salinarchaeum sp. IM2453]